LALVAAGADRGARARQATALAIAALINLPALPPGWWMLALIKKELPFTAAAPAAR
jgi:hypothetical protein